MKKFYDKLWELIPTLWGLLWMLIITLGSVAVLLAVANWLLSLVGVK